MVFAWIVLLLNDSLYVQHFAESMQNMQHFERELDQRGASSILRLLRNTLFGFDLPRNHFLCGIFARMVRFYSLTETTQFQHEGWITCFGLGLKGWPVMEVFIR